MLPVIIYPKGNAPASIVLFVLSKNLDTINHRPKRNNGYTTPAERLQEESLADYKQLKAFCSFIG